MASKFKALEKKEDQPKIKDKRINKQRVLVLSSRGIIHRLVNLEISSA